MKTLLLGASGATGRLLVNELISKDIEVTVIVRNKEKFETLIVPNPKIRVIEGNILDMPDAEVLKYVNDNDSFLSCLGHNISLKGLFGKPRRLVTDSIKRIVNAHLQSESNIKKKLVLMNTTGNCNHDENEKPPLSQRFVVFLLRYLLPPHADNESAANFLRISIGQNNNFIEWVAVRPDGLIDEKEVSEYQVSVSPSTNVIFNPGKTSRINVAHFMASLLKTTGLWQKWAGKMPVVYNCA
jgi:putative NADH-flavin reductase